MNLAALRQEVIMPNLISPYIVDDCPLCGLQVESLTLNYPNFYSSLFLQGVNMTPVAPPQPQHTFHLSPCGHNVQAHMEGSQIRLEQAPGEYQGMPSDPTVQKFVWRLSGLAAANNWFVSFDNTPSALCAHWVCPHAESVTQLIAYQAVLTAYTEWADSLFGQHKKNCEHAHGDTYTSLAAYSFGTPMYATGGGLTWGSTGGDLGGGTLSFLARVCPVILSHRESCPEQPCPLYRDTPVPLSSLIQHINDLHKWSRGKVAAWLDTLEVDLTIDMEGAKNAFAGTNQAPALQAGEPF